MAGSVFLNQWDKGVCWMKIAIISPRNLVREMERFKRQKDPAILADLREPADYRKKHWPEAVNYPYDWLEECRWENKMPFSKGQRVILYCSHGSSSMQMARDLGKEGYRVATVNGGFAAMERFF